MAIRRDRIAQLRKKLGYSGEKLGKLAGLTQGFISAIERGIKDPSVNTLAVIAETLNTTVAYLMGETDDPDLPAVGYSKRAASNDRPLGSGGNGTATYRSVSNLNGTETTTNTSAEEYIIVECGDGAKKIRLIFPKTHRVTCWLRR
jgi:transcriptional regulator with XRE-family HTH domain